MLPVTVKLAGTDNTLTFKEVKAPAESLIRDHLLFCNHNLALDDFTILAQGSNKFSLEIKESLLIKYDKPALNKNISSAPLFLFDKVQYDWITSIIINYILIIFVTVFLPCFLWIYRKNDCLKMGAAALETLQKS